MELTPEVAGLGLRLSETLARNTATVISDRIRAFKASSKSEETIAGLEELVSDLIADKAELGRIAQAYQSELVAQRLSAGDVEYITRTVIPVLKQLFESSGEMSEESEKRFEAVESLLSAETVNVLQLLGFNFRRAIGEPLTELLEKKILANANNSDELKLAVEKRQMLYIQLALDPEAYQRFREMFAS